MECRRGLAMRILSVRLSVKRVHCDKTEEKSVQIIGVARGCSGCTCTPRTVKKKFFRPNLQEKMCKCTPAGHEVHSPARARVNF